jgi:hypothetical protein
MAWHVGIHTYNVGLWGKDRSASEGSKSQEQRGADTGRPNAREHAGVLLRVVCERTRATAHLYTMVHADLLQCHCLRGASVQSTITTA